VQASLATASVQWPTVKFAIVYQSSHTGDCHKRSSATAETVCVGGYYAVQGHSRSPILVSIKKNIRLPISQ